MGSSIAQRQYSCVVSSTQTAPYGVRYGACAVQRVFNYGKSISLKRSAQHVLASRAEHPLFLLTPSTITTMPSVCHVSDAPHSAPDIHIPTPPTLDEATRWACSSSRAMSADSAPASPRSAATAHAL